MPSLSTPINQRLSKDNQAIDMMRFVSSNLHSGLYDDPHNELYIRFLSDRIYIYQYPIWRVWAGLKKASSHGSYFHDKIRTSYYYEELTASDWPQQGRAAPQNNETVRKFLQ